MNYGRAVSRSMRTVLRSTRQEEKSNNGGLRSRFVLACSKKKEKKKQSILRHFKNFSAFMNYYILLPVSIQMKSTE
jgi:hypothetical protein